MKAKLGISTPVALIMVIALVISAWLLYSENASKGSAAVHATDVTTQVVAGATVGRKVTFSVSPRLGDGGSTNR
jgi:hypothetical protein